jgi:hypothetical protein
MPDYFSAARRHLGDGDFLYLHERHPNAVQLWAYGGECTLKAIAFKQGHFQVNQNGKPNSGFGLHLNEVKNGNNLISLYNAAQSGQNSIMGPTSAFVGWDINARYDDGSHLLSNIAQYKNDAAFFLQMLNSVMSA